ncbi:hypothetical protein E3U43_021891, partial [Larimichthys crocea]
SSAPVAAAASRVTELQPDRLYLYMETPSWAGNTLCKSGSIAVFGNVVYSGLLNDHLWHLGVPLFTRLSVLLKHAKTTNGVSRTAFNAASYFSVRSPEEEHCLLLLFNELKLPQLQCNISVTDSEEKKKEERSDPGLFRRSPLCRATHSSGGGTLEAAVKRRLLLPLPPPPPLLLL